MARKCKCHEQDQNIEILGLRSLYGDRNTEILIARIKYNNATNMVHILGVYEEEQSNAVRT